MKRHSLYPVPNLLSLERPITKIKKKDILRRSETKKTLSQQQRITLLNLVNKATRTDIIIKKKGYFAKNYPEFPKN